MGSAKRMAASSAGPSRQFLSKLRTGSGPILLVVAFFALWELLARTVFSGRFLVPPPETVLWGIWRDRGVYHTRSQPRFMRLLWVSCGAI